MKNLLIPIAFLGSAALSCAAYSELKVKTTEYSLKTDKISTSITAAVLSDLHFSVFGKDNRYLVEKVKKTNPDMILLAGDFFDFHGGKSNCELVKKTLTQFTKIAPVYLSPGNHEKRFDLLANDDWRKQAEECGVTVLDGEWADIEIKGQNVRIGGIFDHSIYLEDYGERWQTSPVYKYLKEFEKTDSLKLLLMHRPNTFIYTDDAWDIDAVFSGHTHGGIWQVPFIGGVFAPEQGFFPEYDKGEFSFGKMKMFLSSGLEGHYLIPRAFNRTEFLKLTIDN